MKMKTRAGGLFDLPSFGGLWLEAADAIRQSDMKIYGLDAPTTFPPRIERITFDSPMSPEALVGIEIHYGDVDLSDAPRASVVSVRRWAVETVWDTRLVWKDSSAVPEEVYSTLDLAFHGVEIEHGPVKVMIQGTGDDADWSGSLQIDDAREETRVSIHATHWTSGRLKLTLIDDIEPLLLHRWRLIQQGETYSVMTVPPRKG